MTAVVLVLEEGNEEPMSHYRIAISRLEGLEASAQLSNSRLVLLSTYSVNNSLNLSNR